ncbi:MAG: alcohol dehydrogenase catalytic domain-containing protein [Saprospiraceae bacterium]|nr:alcohol dehydrogenase catalytic domain-containing protein [Saprospiraceae bacterium]
MKALTFRGRENIAYESVADPVIQSAGDVIVEVSSCAICGSDLHPYHEREKGLDHGCVMGHEFTGQVVETGKAVKLLKPGDAVISPFTVSCGQCFYCRKGLTSRCEQSQLFGWRENGVGLNGGQAEYVRVPLADTTLVRRPTTMTDEVAILLGDILSTGYFCSTQAHINPEDIQVVVGCGPVGLMAIWAAYRLGAQRVFAIDQVPQRLAMAEAWGAIPINYLEINPVDVIREATAGRGADQVLEVVGLKSAVRSAFDLLRPGGTLSAVGVCNSTHLPFSPTEAYDQNLTYRIGRCPARGIMEGIMDWAMEDADQLSSVFTHIRPLQEGPSAYHLFDQKADGCMKVLLKPE